MTRLAPRIAFALALVVWTILLLRPTPQEVTAELREWSDILPLVVAKTLHVTGYAGFAGGALVLFGRRRWWVFGGVAVHAVLGEMGQYLGNLWFATGRVGCVTDVLIDWTGMGLGWAAWRVVIGFRRRQPHPNSP